ncbi:MAG: hypothetical protein NZM44_07450 [Candidatus Calescibacterium sp.]|nr:hypothetical protein [Candidatus Calescibacterium sp.]
MVKQKIIKTNHSFPIWLMRQSGRYLPEYKQLREKYSFMDILENPELICYLTSLPLKYFNLDALIIFSDISVVFSLIKNTEYTIEDKKGPVVTINDINKISLKDESKILENISLAIVNIKKQEKLPLIGFTGGLYTTFLYLIKNTNYDKSILYSNEDILLILMEAIYKTLKTQIEAGVDIIQIFDTYLFDLSPLDFEFLILPIYKILLNKLKQEYSQTPVIFFTLNTINIIEYIKDLKIDCLSVDWRKDLNIYFNNFDGYVQGNLDPHILTIQDRNSFLKILDLSILRIFSNLNINQNKERYIFNLGHGLLPNTKIENVKILIEKLRERSD